MDIIDPKIRELIGIAASVAGHCQPCFDYHLEEARKMGIADADVRTAVKIAQSIREAGDSNMDKYIQEKLKIDKDVANK